MFKSAMTSPTPAAAAPLRADQAEQDHDSAAEQEQARHRTAIRIVGIEGIEVFADLADADKSDSTTPPSGQSR